MTTRAHQRRRSGSTVLVHMTARAAPGTLLFVYWFEARKLWDLLSGIPGIRAVCLMPDHIHLLIPEDQVGAFHNALMAYALWRNRLRGERGPVWKHGSAGTHPNNDQHGEMTLRYVHLNSCRAQLTSDPLAWAFSTHRDACGLALNPIVATVPNPDAFHAMVSSDRYVQPDGTKLPKTALSGVTRSIGTLEQVFAAVSALTRTPAAQMRIRGNARTLFVRAARSFTDASPAEIARAAGVGLSTVFRVNSGRSARRDPELQLVGRVLGDARFPLLSDREVWRNPGPGWGRYRTRGERHTRSR